MKNELYNDVILAKETDMVLWGWKPFCNTPIKICIGSMRMCESENKRRKKEGWILAIFKRGDSWQGTGFALEIENYREKSK